MMMQGATAGAFLGMAPWAAGMAAGGWLLGGQIGALSAVIARWFLPAILVLGAGVLLVKLGRAMTPSAG